MSGELMSVIGNINFKDRDELLQKLRTIRDSVVKFAPPKRYLLKKLIGISIQQVYFSSEQDIMNYKNYLDSRKNSMKKRGFYAG
jgi:hypothetical protein